MLAVPGARAQTKSAAAEQELREAVQKYMAGYGSNTVEGYFQNYAPDITMWWPNGVRMARESYHKTWTDTLAGGNTVVSAVADDVRIHAAPSGDAGVASFVWKISRKNGNPVRSRHLGDILQARRDVADRAHAVQPHGTAARWARRWPGTGSRSGRGAGTRRRTRRPGAARSGSAASFRGAAAGLDRRGTRGSEDDCGSQPRVRRERSGRIFFALRAGSDRVGVPAAASIARHTKGVDGVVQKTGGLASAESSDVRVQVSPGGDLAVASHLLKVTRKNPGPEWPEKVTYEVSPTLIKRNGAWTIVHIHVQIVPEPRPAA